MTHSSRPSFGVVITQALLIVLGSVLYALGTVLFVFPGSLIFGGTSGVSVILEFFLDFSPGTILTVINTLLLVAAFAVLGKGMALKTLAGSVLTTLFVAVFERLFALREPLLTNPFLCAAVGAVIIAIASGVMFYVDSSSGGTDIIALIIRKFSDVNIGKALLLADVLIVVVGGYLSGLTVFLSSVLGLLIKTFGIDLVLGIIKRTVSRNAR
ncbi:MAG: YitT family protein [Clostridia bacterium]|nr:YitT family protein [Clostridia bacterium]